MTNVPEAEVPRLAWENGITIQEENPNGLYR